MGRRYLRSNENFLSPQCQEPYQVQVFPYNSLKPEMKIGILFVHVVGEVFKTRAYIGHSTPPIYLCSVAERGDQGMIIISTYFFFVFITKPFWVESKPTSSRMIFASLLTFKLLGRSGYKRLWWRTLDSSLKGLSAYENITKKDTFKCVSCLRGRFLNQSNRKMRWRAHIVSEKVTFTSST